MEDQPEARSRGGRPPGAGSRPSLVVAGGGGGTLRAVVEGVLEAVPPAPPGPDVVRLAALRMGSGTVVARRLGIPRDPFTAARQVGEGWARNVPTPVAVIRCTHGLPGGGAAVRHAVTMCGLGQWGLVPGAIARWRQRHARGRKRAAAFMGLERVNA